MHDGKGNTPIPAYILQDTLHFFAVFGADFAAVQYLLAQRIQTHKEHLASFLTGTVDVQDVAAPMSHVLSEEHYAPMVNDLEICHELLRQVAYRPFRNLSAIMARQIHLDFRSLATFHKPRDTDMHQYVVGDCRSSSDDALQLL